MKDQSNLTATSEPVNPYEVGDGVTLCGYSDRHAYTVIAVTKTQITLQRDKATLLNGFKSGEPDALTFTPGGFSGHTEGVQRYAYEADPEGEIIVARMKRKLRKSWEQVGGEDGHYDHVYRADFGHKSSHIIAGRHEHYDYNF